MRAVIAIAGLVLVLTVVTGNDVKMRLRMRPPVMVNFNPVKRMGQWFNQYWFAPCTWSGSSQLTDHTIINMPGEKGVVRQQITWRSKGQCTSVEHRLYPNKIQGVYTLVDTIGNLLSGELCIVATDYNCFNIGWGCTRLNAMDNTCDDPYLTISTRMIKPDPKCLQKVDQVLANVFQIRLGDLLRVQHGQSCLAPLHPPKKGLY